MWLKVKEETESTTELAESGIRMGDSKGLDGSRSGARKREERATRTDSVSPDFLPESRQTGCSGVASPTKASGGDGRAAKG